MVGGVWGFCGEQFIEQVDVLQEFYDYFFDVKVGVLYFFDEFGIVFVFDEDLVGKGDVCVLVCYDEGFGCCVVWVLFFCCRNYQLYGGVVDQEVVVQWEEVLLFEVVFEFDCVVVYMGDGVVEFVVGYFDYEVGFGCDLWYLFCVVFVLVCCQYVGVVYVIYVFQCMCFC